MATTSEGDAQPSGLACPTLTVAAVARRLGVAPSTLRTWDRRYGLGPGDHTAGSHRRYSAADLARLVVMRRLTLEGVPPAEAAHLAKSCPPDQRDVVAPVLSLPAPAPAPGLESGQPRQSPHRPVAGERPRSGGGRVIALPEGSPATRGLARAAMSLDCHEMTRVLRDAVRQNGVVRAWDTVAMPVLTAIGERWQVTGEGVDVEHALSESVVAVMRGVAASLHRPRNVRPVMLGCAEGDTHSLPLHVLAAALAEEDVSCRMFGAGMPPGALLSAVRRSGPAVVFLYAVMPVRSTAVLEEVPRQRPSPRVIVGGTGWDPSSLPRCARLVTSLGQAVDEITAAAGL
jgi:DNA-binding transcriptional MerR regulator